MYQSLTHFRLPTPISYIGMDHKLGAMNAMYPWLTSLIFVVPMFFVKNKMLCLVIGFVILNLFTALNFYVLIKKLTDTPIYQYLGVVLYVFNGYHLEDMYVRNAMVESLAYAFLPLVVLGSIMIWTQEDKTKGIIFLSFGFIGVLNSHILSFVLVIGCLFIAEIIRLLLGKFSKNECIAFLFTGLLSIAGSSYALFQFLKTLLLNKHLYMPSSHLNFVSPQLALQEMVNNHMRVLYSTWHIGLSAFALLIFLIVMSMGSKKLSAWIWLSWCALFGLLFSFGFIPYPIFLNRLIQKFQFTGRIYVLVVLFISVAMTLYVSYIKTSKWVVALVMILTVSLGWSSIMNYKNNPLILDHAETMHTLSNDSYDWMYNNGAILCKDYTIINPVHMKVNKIPKQVVWKQSSYNSATYDVEVAKKGLYCLPMSHFYQQKYKLVLNGNPIDYHIYKGYFEVQFVRPNNVLKITSNISWINYLIFIISMAVIIGLFYYLLKF